MIPLNFNDAVLDCTASATATFQLAGKALDSLLPQRDSGNNCNVFAATAFTFTPDPDDTVTL